MLAGILLHLLITSSMPFLSHSSEPLVCQPSSVQSNVFKNKSWIFGETMGGSWARSNEMCMESGYAASIECQVTQNPDGSKKAFYDHSTLHETECTQSFQDILHQLEMPGHTTESVDGMTASMDILSSSYSRKSSGMDLPEMVAAVIKLSNVVEEQDLEVAESSMVHMFWLMDNLHATLKNEGVDQLNNRQKSDLINALDVFAENVLLNQKSGVRLVSQSSVFEAKMLNPNSTGGVTFVYKSKITSYSIFGSPVTAQIPQSGLPTNQSINTKVASFYFHEDSVLFPEPEECNIKVEQALSVQVSHTELVNMNEPIVHSFPRKNTETIRKSGKCSIRHERCGYLNISDGAWKYNGCTTNVNAVHGSTLCQCNHATNFAVLVQTQELQSSFALSIIGTVGCACSVAGLSLLLIIYTSFRSLRTKRVNQIHVQLCVCLLVGYITFLAGVHRPRSYVPCLAVGAVIQFAFLSAWGWMLVEFIAMYKKLVQVFGNISGRFLMRSAMMVYGLSMVVTVLTFAIAVFFGDMRTHRGWHRSPDNDPLCWKSYYVSDRLCWLHSYSLFLGFLAPIAVVFVINFVGYFRVLKATSQSTLKVGRTTRKVCAPKDKVFRVFTLSILLGVTWCFAVPLALSDDKTLNEVFSWLFSISNAFQGLFIFILYCVKRDDVRRIWTSPILRILRQWKKSEDQEILATASRSTHEEKVFSNPSFNPNQE